MKITRCLDCDRLLDQQDEPLSESVGFDCAACAVLSLCETAAPLPDLPADDMRVWLAPRLARVRKLRCMIGQALAAVDEYDMQERLLVICTQRLLMDGLNEQQARAKAKAILSQPLSFALPSIDDLDEPLR